MLSLPFNVEQIRDIVTYPLNERTFSVYTNVAKFIGFDMNVRASKFIMKSSGFEMIDSKDIDDWDPTRRYRDAYGDDGYLGYLHQQVEFLLRQKLNIGLPIGPTGGVREPTFKHLGDYFFEHVWGDIASKIATNFQKDYSNMTRDFGLSGPGALPNKIPYAFFINFITPTVIRKQQCTYTTGGDLVYEYESEQELARLGHNFPPLTGRGILTFPAKDQRIPERSEGVLVFDNNASFLTQYNWGDHAVIVNGKRFPTVFRSTCTKFRIRYSTKTTALTVGAQYTVSVFNTHEDRGEWFTARKQ